MSLDGGIVGENYRVWFVLDDGNGVLKTGLVAGDFTVNVIPTDDSASTAVTVTESSQVAGLYYFDIPGSFLVTHGDGQYVVPIVVAATGPKFDAVGSKQLHVSVSDIDVLGAQLAEVWQDNELDSANPVVHSPTQRVSGTIVKDIVEAPPGTFTTTRQP